MPQIAHIGIGVKDAEESMSFYKKVFGCSLISSYENDRVKIIFANCGNNVLEFVQNKAAAQALSEGVISHIAFTVENIEESIKRIKELGVNCLSREPIDFNGGKIFFFEGPDGEKIEFVENNKGGKINESSSF